MQEEGRREGEYVYLVVQYYYNFLKQYSTSAEYFKNSMPPDAGLNLKLHVKPPK